MTDTPHPFTDDELIAFLRGVAPADLSARITEARTNNPALEAELAVMAGLKPALAEAGGPTPPNELAWRRLETAIRRETPTPAASPRRSMWMAASVVFFCLAAAQFAYLTWSAVTPQQGYQTASGVSLRFGLGVRFAPDATEAEIRALMQDTGAWFADGPGASGLYRVAFQSAVARDAALPKLEESGIVTLVARE